MKTGKLTVFRGYGLTDHLLELKVNQSCTIPLTEYSISVVRVTAAKLKKRGFLFKVQQKRKRDLAEGTKVTRLA